jgi:arginase
MSSAPAAALTVFAGRCADRNDRGMAGAQALGAALAARMGLQAKTVGAPAPALSAAWDVELAAARLGLDQLSARLEVVLGAGLASLTTLGRCAASIATLPVIARRRPDAAVVWFDAHADSNTPAQSSTGYLGGMVLSGAAGLWETGLGAGLSLANVVLVGVRDIDPAERRLIEAGAPILVAPGADFAARLARAVDGRAVYVHLDCDVLEPGLVPTEYRAPGGLDLTQLQHACAVLAQHEVVGLEVAEFEAVWAETGRPAETDRLLDALSPLLKAVVDG